jgi:hypothetical protein
MVTVNVSLPTGAVTVTVHVSGVEPVAGTQPGELGVRLATTVDDSPPTDTASDCVEGEM